MKAHCLISLAISLLIGVVFIDNGYGFYLAKIWVNKDIYNDIFNKPYTVGDCFSAVMGVFFGMNAVG